MAVLGVAATLHPIGATQTRPLPPEGARPVVVPVDQRTTQNGVHDQTTTLVQHETVTRTQRVETRVRTLVPVRVQTLRAHETSVVVHETTIVALHHDDELNDHEIDLPGGEGDATGGEREPLDLVGATVQFHEGEVGPR